MNPIDAQEQCPDFCRSPVEREGIVCPDLDPKQRIEEAHGLWELAVTRVALFAEMIVASGGQKSPGISLQALALLVKDERDSFLNWQAVSREVGA